ncbi:hypothetical protein D3C87_2076220 [compost metagenome]
MGSRISSGGTPIELLAKLFDSVPRWRSRPTSRVWRNAPVSNRVSIWLSTANDLMLSSEIAETRFKVWPSGW